MDVSAVLVNSNKRTSDPGYSAISPGHLLAILGSGATSVFNALSSTDLSYSGAIPPLPGPFQNIYNDIFSNIQLKSVTFDFNVSGGIINVGCDVVLYLNICLYYYFSLIAVQLWS